MKNSKENEALNTVFEALQDKQKELDNWINELPEKVLFSYDEIRFNLLTTKYRAAINLRNSLLRMLKNLYPDYPPYTQQKFESEIMPLFTQKKESISSVLKLLWLDHQGAGFNFNMKGTEVLLKASAAPNILDQFNYEYPSEIEEVVNFISQNYNIEQKYIIPENIIPSFTEDQYVLDQAVTDQIKTLCSTFFNKAQLQEYFFAHSAAQVFNGLHQRGIGFNRIPDFPSGLLNIIEPGIKYGGIATQYNNYKPAQHLHKGVVKEKEMRVRILNKSDLESIEGNV